MLQTATRRIRFQRAVFTSTGSNQVRGYHLVARSAGIDDEIAQVLCQWSPTHDGLCESGMSAGSLNYYPVDDRHFALSKSIIGGAEYSGRSALQTVTSILVGRREDLYLYRNNPLAIARLALSMGWLRLIVDYESPLELAELPAHGFPEKKRRAASPADTTVRAISALAKGCRIAIIGSENPTATLVQIFEHLPDDLRAATSFSTGIKPSTFRPFQIQLFNKMDARLRDNLNQQRITTISCGALS